MIDFDLLFRLLGYDRKKTWMESLFLLAENYGFSQLYYAVNASKHATPEFAFVCSNYAAEWLSVYEAEKYYNTDPVLRHCMNSTLPLTWERETFKSRQEKQLYEAACTHGLDQGVAFPVHGPNGEFGILNLVPGKLLRESSQQEFNQKIADWALIRDYVFESSKRFTTVISDDESEASLTPREIECLNWAAEGKSSWEISTIFNCSEATVNFHFSNIRRKFAVNSRQQAIVKAMRLGLISPNRL